MSEQPFQSLEEHFGDLPDPRVVGRCEHGLLDMIIIAIVCVQGVEKEHLNDVE